MATLEQKIKNDNALCRILKTKEIRYHIGTTDRNASLDLIFNKEDLNYHFNLDAAPLEHDENEALLKIYGLK